MKYKQTIHIGNNITDIMNLPCVFSCHKDYQNNIVYLLYNWDDDGRYVEARKGDWLCQDYEGYWHKLSGTEYEQS